MASDRSLLSPPLCNGFSPRALLYPHPSLQRILKESGGEASDSDVVLPGTISALHCSNCTALGPVVGTPLAALAAETALASGAREVIFVGTAGALAVEGRQHAVGDIVLPERWLTDSALPALYGGAQHGNFETGAQRRRLEAQFGASGLTANHGVVWCTDAPYRETEHSVRTWQRQGATLVEMECAGIAAVCAGRGVPFIAALIVSDIVKHPWESGFRTPAVRKNLKAVLRAVLALPPA